MARRRKTKRRLATPSGDQPKLTGVALLLSETPADTLDLHGYSSAQAELRFHDFLRTRSVDSGGRVLHVITGRGLGSEGAPVLPPLVRELIAHDYAEYVAESAGLPGGGGVAIRLR
jgi:DNA-nicking Smr family endonuclease